ncbi:MAG: peptidase T [Paludibacteraceae bacterium]|jgi:tripeptide aminopeptidase|nr:peptidase T [Paludibacteraceae bacterium]MBR1716014.1 peptidase T [Paludibacteraceae bacterium]
MNIVDRFLKYVSFHTTSDENTNMTPSTPGQMEFAKYLKEELLSIGMQEVSLDKNGYIMATLPSNQPSEAGSQTPTIGFIAHMDTAPDASGKNVRPRIVKAYDGKDIVLNEEENIVLETAKYPEILHYQGQDIIVTNGKTLLGADDKAGIAEIVTAMEYLLRHPEIKHGKIRVGFTPDEEIGQGADHFDVKAFGADFAYTMDGGAIGELEYENFNAAGCKIHIHGTNVHPGSAYHKMVNSMRIGYQLAVMLPRWETPEHTQDYEGFYHLISMSGTVEETTLSYIIRDHDRARFESRKRELEHLVRKVNREYGEGTAEIEIRDQYYNMREKIEPVMHIIDLAKEAMTAVGVTPKVKPIRGGTDGARLSFEGLPCPNIFAGGENFHSRYEYLPVPSLEKACEVILQIVQKAGK